MRIRSLTDAEKSTLRASLKRMAKIEKGDFDRFAWSASAMLEQNMVDNFLWIQKREEEK